MISKWICCGLLFCSLLPAQAEFAVVRTSGSSLRLVHSESVEMVSEDIDMRVLSQKQPGIMEYHCHFVLHNTAEEEAQFQVGFPLDGPAPTTIQDAAKAIKGWAFTVRDSSANYEVNLVDGPEETRRQYKKMFLWNMRMKPGETRDLWVDYRLGPSIRPLWLRQQDVPAPPLLTKLCKIEPGADMGWGYAFGYTTSSGATWKGGHIGQAKFTLHDKEFREGMDALAGLPGLGSREELAEEAGTYNFSGALPCSRKITADGYQWEFQDFVPGQA